MTDGVPIEPPGQGDMNQLLDKLDASEKKRAEYIGTLELKEKRIDALREAISDCYLESCRLNDSELPSISLVSLVHDNVVRTERKARIILGEDMEEMKA